MNSMPDGAATLTILSVSDDEYLPRLAALAQSLHLNMPTAHLSAWLVNIAPGETLAGLQQVHAPMTFTHVDVPLDAEQSMLGLDGKTFYTEKSGFCVNLRARGIHRLLLDGHQRILSLDADSLVRGDLGGLLQLLERHDIAIHKRDSEPDYMRVAGGAIAVRNTPSTVQFFARMIELIDELGPRTFFSDQWAFHLASTELGQTTDIAHLPRTYIDWEFREDSVIWTGKGQRKHHDKTYRREEDNYKPSQWQ